MRNTNKSKIGLYTLITCLVLLAISTTGAMEAQHIDFQVDTGNIIRSENEVLVRIMLTNTGNESYARINSIKFSDTKSSPVMSENIGFSLKPIGREIARVTEISKTEKMDFQMYQQTYEGLSKSMENSSILKTYSLDLKKIKPVLNYGDNITFEIKVEYTQNEKTHILSKTHTVVVLEPLQSQLERLEKLSRGYREKTEEEKRIENKCRQLVATNSSKILKELNKEKAFSNKTNQEIYIYCKVITTLPPIPPEISSVQSVSAGVKLMSTNLASAPTKPTTPTFNRWYVGDQHVHSIYSSNLLDGCIPYINPKCLPAISNMTARAKELNFNWVHFTEHAPHINSNEYVQGYSECGNQNTVTFKCLYGLELTLRNPTVQCSLGEYLALGIGSNYVDSGCYGTIEACNCDSPQQGINEVFNAGGFGYIAHPYDEKYWYDWTVKGFTGLEVINTLWDNNDAKAVYNPSTSTVDSYREFLQNNKKVFAVANSDAHNMSHLGRAFTYCWMDSLSETNILDALKNGRCVASNGPLVLMSLNGKSIGETSNFCSGTNTLKVAASSDSIYGTLRNVEVYVDGNLAKNISLSGSTDIKYISLSLTSSNKNVFVAVYTTSGYRAFTNPIFLNSASCTSESIPLVNGWNLISFQKWPRNMSPESVLSGIRGKYNIVWYFDSGDVNNQWKRYVPGGGSNSLIELNPKEGLWIMMTSTATLTNTGVSQSYDDIPLYYDQNMVGYPSSTSRAVDTALASIRGNYSIVWQYNASTGAWLRYVPGSGSNTLKNMIPKYGYWITLNVDSETLTINA